MLAGTVVNPTLYLAKSQLPRLRQHALDIGVLR